MSRSPEQYDDHGSITHGAAARIGLNLALVTAEVRYARCHFSVVLSKRSTLYRMIRTTTRQELLCADDGGGDDDDDDIKSV